MKHPVLRWAAGLLALLVIGLSIVALERDRAGLAIRDIAVGTTPATLYQAQNSNGPAVVVAHGFAGSRQIMQAYSLRLAQAGYRVLAFDFEGHGRNPSPMSGDVTSIDGTTAILVRQTQAVIAAARTLPGRPGVALLGHSMATDIIARASLAEDTEGRPIAAIVGISMFSEAVTGTAPVRLLMISGQWERALRRAALDAVHLVDPTASLGDLAEAGGVTRQAIVAPHVEHVGVLFSPAAVDAAQGWLDETFGRSSSGQAGPRGLWILALLGGIVLAAAPLVRLLPEGPQVPSISNKRFWLAAIAPGVVVPLVLAPLYRNFMPVLVADYLMLHLAAYGLVQLSLLGGLRLRMGAVQPLAALGLALWGIVVFGVALDRYAASFWPTPERLAIIAVLCIGTVPFLLGDSLITGSGRGTWWRRIVPRLMLIVSLGIAAALKPQELTFVLIVLPVVILFFCVHGLMGRWVGQRAGWVPAGVGLGLCLAWALGVSFPLFA